MAVTLYHSGQTDAPQFTKATSLENLCQTVINIFKKILVEGYGSMSPAGWSVVEEGTLTDDPQGPACIFQNQAGEQFWIGPLAYTSSYIRTAGIFGASSFSLDLQTISHLVNYFEDDVVYRTSVQRLRSASWDRLGFRYTLFNDKDSYPWLAIANDKFIYFFVGPSTRRCLSIPIVFGTSPEGSHVVGMGWYRDIWNYADVEYFGYSVDDMYKQPPNIWVLAPHFDVYGRVGSFLSSDFGTSSGYYMPDKSLKIPLFPAHVRTEGVFHTTLPGAKIALLHWFPWCFSFSDPLANYDWWSCDAPVTSLFEELTLNGKQAVRVQAQVPFVISLEEEDWQDGLF